MPAKPAPIRFSHHRPFFARSSQALSKQERKKVVGAKSAFAWFLKTEKRMWHFVCEDATERERWIANVRATDRRPFARFCFGCLMHATVPSPSQYVAAGAHKALAGPLAGSVVYVVLARGHCFVFASSTQHELDRSRVLPHGILHLHGSVVSRLRKGLWQVVTPNDAAVHQFELIAKGGAPALETEFDEWMAALRQEQHVPAGEEAPTSIDGPRVNPEDVDVNELRKVLYRSEAETESYRDVPKNSLADKRVSLARLGVGPRSTAIDVALQAVSQSSSSSDHQSGERRVSRVKSVRTARSRTGKDDGGHAPLHASAAALDTGGDAMSASLADGAVSPRLKRSRSVDRAAARGHKNGSPALEARLAFVASASRSSPTGINADGAVSRGRASTTSSPRAMNASGNANPLMASPTRHNLSSSGNSPSPHAMSPRAMSPARSVSPRTLLPSSPSAHRRVSEKQMNVKPRDKQGDSSDSSESAARTSLAEIQMTLGGFRLDDSKELASSTGAAIAPIDEEYYYDEIVSQRKSSSKPATQQSAAPPDYDDDDDDEATLVVDEVHEYSVDGGYDDDEVDENEESSGDEMD